jgi:lipopolysaccharide export system protein LptA
MRAGALPCLAAAALVLAAPAMPAPPSGSALGRSLVLRADAVTVRAGGMVIEARGAVRLTDGRIRAQAARARYSARARRVDLAGSVAVDAPEGAVRAERALLLLDAGGRVAAVEAAGHAVLTAGGRRVEADRLRYTVDGAGAAASGHVRLRLPPDLVASADRLTWRGGTAVLSGGAKVETPQAAIEGETIEAVEAEQTAVVRGGVRATAGELRITASTATLHGRERRVVFRDDVLVVRAGRTLRARVVTVFLDERRLVAEGETTIRIEEEGEGR